MNFKFIFFKEKSYYQEMKFGELRLIELSFEVRDLLTLGRLIPCGSHYFWLQAYLQSLPSVQARDQGSRFSSCLS